MVTRRRAETRGRLLDAALRVFADKGWGQARIEEICEAAGYTRGAFYSNFASLDELFFALYDDRAELIAAQLTAALAAPDRSFRSVIARTADTLLLDRDWLLIKTDFLLHAARNPQVAGRLAEHRARLREAIEQRLATLPLDLPDVPGTARAVIAAYDGVTVQLLLDADVNAARAWLTELLTTLLVR
ncbi:TetR/AcrR family transcriptional regulator [Actinoplanes siamensis]|nr:TetR/AcrR family transcriptional regulator [Actinoplanes siamensis]